MFTGLFSFPVGVMREVSKYVLEPAEEPPPPRLAFTYRRIQFPIRIGAIRYLPIPSYFPTSISLNLSKITRLMQSLGDTYGRTIILRMTLYAVSPKKEAAQIRHLPAHEREQFRVICYLKKALWISEGLSRNWPFLVSLRLTVPAS